MYMSLKGKAHCIARTATTFHRTFRDACDSPGKFMLRVTDYTSWIPEYLVFRNACDYPGIFLVMVSDYTARILGIWVISMVHYG